MKKIMYLGLFILLTFSSIPCHAANSNEVTVILNGNLITFDVPAQVINDRTMVPVRKIFEELGMTVDWNSDTETVMAYKRGVLIQLPINSYTIYRNTVEQKIDVPAQVINDRTLVPIRVVSEYAGAVVNWDGDTNTVYINSTDNIKYIDWNNEFDYYGEVRDGKATGYGILYSKNDNSMIQLGKYIDSQIVEGSLYFDNGDMYSGTFENATFLYGTYCFADGSSYTGEFKNARMHGDGIFTYTDGSFHKGKWENDLPNGWGIFYDAVEDVQYQGNYVNGKRDGDFIIDDFFENKTYYVSYNNNNINTDTNTNTNTESVENNKNAEIAEYYEQVAELEQEYTELNSWYVEEMSKLYDYVQNGDPFSTDWAKSIYESYGITDETPATDSNIDSYAAANAARQRAALKAQADSEILKYNSTYIDTQKQLIEDTYNARKKQLDSMKKTLELKKQVLGL